MDGGASDIAIISGSMANASVSAANAVAENDAIVAEAEKLANKAIEEEQKRYVCR